MKKCLLILLLSVSALFAQPQEKTTLDPIATSNDFILAQSYYKLGDFTASYNAFKKLFLQHTDHVDINYYLAMSAVELKLYDEASAAFERVLIMKPDFHRARLEFARVQFLLGFKQEAKKEFLKVAQYPIPPNVRKNIERYLEKIDNNSSLNSTFIAVSFGYMYDNNINNGLDQNSYSLPGFYNLSVAADKPESSTAYTSSFQINHLQSLGVDSPSILKHTGTMFYKNQTEDDKYNFAYYAYTPTLIYNDPVRKSEYSLKLGIEKIYPGDRVNFSVYSLSPKYRVLLNKDTIFSAYMDYKEFHYIEDIDEDKDYNKVLLGTSIKYKAFEYSIEFDEDDRTRGTRTDLNKKSVTNTFMYQYNIQPSLFLNLKYQHRQVKYQDVDAFFANQRKDNINQYNVGLTHIINKKDFVSLSYTQTDNNTNQSAYDYNKDTVYVNYTWRFKL